MTQTRYKIKRVTFIAEEYDAVSHPYGIWDKVERVYVNKYGERDNTYYCTSKSVAQMRRRDLNEYARSA
jgi:hypothetical protein